MTLGRESFTRGAANIALLAIDYRRAMQCPPERTSSEAIAWESAPAAKITMMITNWGRIQVVGQRRKERPRNDESILGKVLWHGRLKNGSWIESPSACHFLFSCSPSCNLFQVAMIGCCDIEWRNIELIEILPKCTHRDQASPVASPFRGRRGLPLSLFIASPTPSHLSICTKFTCFLLRIYNSGVQPQICSYEAMAFIDVANSPLALCFHF